MDDETVLPAKNIIFPIKTTILLKRHHVMLRPVTRTVVLCPLPVKSATSQGTVYHFEIYSAP